MSNVVLRVHEAVRAPLERRPKLGALGGALLMGLGFWAGSGFWAGVGFGILVVFMIKIMADRRG